MKIFKRWRKRKAIEDARPFKRAVNTQSEGISVETQVKFLNVEIHRDKSKPVLMHRIPGI